MAHKKGGGSTRNGRDSNAQRLGVKQFTAWKMKHKLAQVMLERDADKRFSGRVEIDDAYLGGERTGAKRGRGAPGKTPFVAAVETTPEGKPVRLTVTEFLILQALAQRPGFVKSRDSLMDAAYDDQVYVDDRTIDSHIKRLRKKFKVVADDFDAIETLYGVGYRYRE